MGYGIENLMDLIMVGGGVVRDKGDDNEMAGSSAAAKMSVSAVAEIANNTDVYGMQVPTTSFFLRGGLEGICSYNGKCQVGVQASFAGVPGILGTFAAVNLGADYSIDDGSKKAFVGGELAFLNIFSPAVEMWSLEGRVTMDSADRSIGFGLFLNVGGSIKAAVKPAAAAGS